MKRAFLSAFLVIALLIPLTNSVSAFSDTEEIPYQSTIEYLQSKGVIKGYASGRFEPGRSINRAEFIKMMLSTYGFEPGEETSFSYPYKDVPENLWYAPYVQRAWELGVIDDNAKFNPTKKTTRVEGTKMVLRLIGVSLPRTIHEEEWPLNYRDVRHDTWYAPTVLYGTSYGIVQASDEENQYFRPLQELSRGEATELLYNMDVLMIGNAYFDTYAELEEDLFGDVLHGSNLRDMPHLDIFADIWNRFHNNYYGREDIDTDALMYGAIKGMVESLGDAYSMFFDPPEADTFDDFLEGHFSGVGAYLMETSEGILIETFVNDSPAERSGLRSRDIIIAVDEIDVTEMTLEAASNLIRGEAGTEVTLTVTREGESQPLSFTLVREAIDIGYIEAEMKGDAIYIDINLFDSLSFIDFTQSITPLIEENPDFSGFVIDVRNNPGGYLTSVMSIIGHFVPTGNAIVYIDYGEGDGDMHISTGNGEWTDYPVVVLINEGSASASEILALALQEKMDALLVGNDSFGKGTIQEVVYYTDGSTLKLTVAEWRSPQFHSINDIGISPDHYVELTQENILAGEDPQLDEALRLLRPVHATGSL